MAKTKFLVNILCLHEYVENNLFLAGRNIHGIVILENGICQNYKYFTYFDPTNSLLEIYSINIFIFMQIYS